MATTRWACAEDLVNYFRKKDLLSGLSDEECSILRANIGITTSEGGQVTPTELLHSELVQKINNSTLVTGARYVITDFRTLYTIDGTVYGGSDSEFPSNNWNLIVTAIDVNKIDKRVVIKEHPDYVVEYDVLPELLADGVLTYGKITYLKDTNNNSAHYDFKNVRFKRTYIEAGKEVTRYLYTFSEIINGEVTDDSNNGTVHDNSLGEQCYNNVFIGDTYYNKFAPHCYGNFFYSGCNDVTFKWESINNFFYERVVDATGTIANKTLVQGNNVLSSTITKYIHNVNETCVVTYFDPDTYAQQLVILPTSSYSHLKTD